MEFKMFGGDFAIKDLVGKRRYLVFPLLSVAVIWISLMLVFIPQTKQVLELREDLETDQERLERVTRKATVLGGLDEASTNSIFEVVERVLPSQKPAFSVLASLRDLSVESDVSVSKFDFSPGSLATESAKKGKKKAQVRLGGLASFPMELNLTGSVEGINRFLQGLDAMAPLVSVEDISLDLKGGGISEGAVSLNVYYSLPPQDIGRVSDPIRVDFIEKYADLLELLATFNVGEGFVPGVGRADKEDLFGF